MNKNLTQIIQDLIDDNKKEGDYWDFKKNPSDNKADLLLDIICLANNTKHRGDRYLIYGVEDKTFNTIGCNNCTNRLTQSNLIDFLLPVSFHQ